MFLKIYFKLHVCGVGVYARVGAGACGVQKRVPAPSVATVTGSCEPPAVDSENQN